jgi:hypothetical protein
VSPIDLPKEFRDVPLSLLWTYARISKELMILAEHDPTEQGYWGGWYDSICSMISDLTHKTTLKIKDELAAKFEDFRMEDELRKLENELRDTNGGLG